jgi:hypothetical protein
VGPVHAAWSAPGDGQWVELPDARHPDRPPLLYKTLLHPDANRSWAEVFVVAVDLSQVSVHLVAGYQEPRSSDPEAKRYERRARVLEADLPGLLAAFNGGFKAEHGQHGMRVDGVTLVRPRGTLCSIAGYDDGRIRVRVHSDLAPSEDRMVWLRQAPPCMVQDGRLHPGLADPEARSWGATLDGETVIRRSAVGVSADGNVLYVSITNSTTARVLAQGLQHAGAADLAQLDVNWSFPKFVTFAPGEAGTDLVAVPLAKGFELDPDDYVRHRSMRDFFYLKRKEAPGVAVKSPASH